MELVNFVHHQDKIKTIERNVVQINVMKDKDSIMMAHVILVSLTQLLMRMESNA